MVLKVFGTILELNNDLDENKKATGTKTAVIYQKGSKSLIAVKKIPDGLLEEGEVIDDFYVNVFPWATDRGAANISFSYSEKNVI